MHFIVKYQKLNWNFIFQYLEYLNAQLIFNDITYIGLNIINKTGVNYNCLDYVEQISKEEKEEINNKLNETLNPNMTHDEKDLLNKKLEKGTYFDRNAPSIKLCIINHYKFHILR